MFSLNQLFYERELDLTPLLAEEEENLRYHERQQAMVDNFRLEKFLMRVAIIEFSRQCDVTETRA